jgi:hypothetical protein
MLADRSRRVTKGSVTLLAFVNVAVMLDARDSQARHSAALDRALPAGEFLKAERVALARFVDLSRPPATAATTSALRRTTQRFV